jgi:hypothetical protein
MQGWLKIMIIRSTVASEFQNQIIEIWPLQKSKSIPF